ncbi:hypothetical protein FNT36_05820 [Hymenobacter setariae]|uniref:Uncharacterized protein n=1 Tax=Hymenobacter setariae TaxID=2594794 RepID=A0A558C4M7_9BACT|nr:hypothetical protein [Hymenobacter setariae]TVT43602.1 hypothetical protein FNT36_05820 [Hymenobacter setariae]
MSYHVHITRKATNWADKNDPATITQAEWEAYVVSDAEMRLNNQSEEPELIADPTEMLHPDGLSIWLPYTERSKAGHYAWFYHDQDHVTVEGPDEEILGKMLAIAHALQARVQGDDGEYFDDPGQPYGLQPEDDGLAWAVSDFREFQTTASAEAAQPLLQALARQGLDYRTSQDNGQVAFDPSFANNQLISKFIIKLRLADFERGSQALADLNQHALSQVDPSHYLFSFSDEELFDLLVKPDEWSAFDVTLAGQQLRQRGRDISPDTLQLLRQRRVAELAQPDQEHSAWVKGGYVSALLGGFLGIVVGYQLYFSRKQLPDGRRMYVYSARDRVHGIRILVLGIIMFLLLLTARLIRLMN